MKKILVVLALLSFVGVAFAAMSTGDGQPAGGDGATWHEGDKDKDWDKDKDKDKDWGKSGDKDKDWDRDHHKKSYKHHCPQGTVYNPKLHKCEKQQKQCPTGTQYNSATNSCVPCPKKCDFNGVCTTTCSSGGGGVITPCSNPPCSAVPNPNPVPLPSSSGSKGIASAADGSNDQTASN